MVKAWILGALLVACGKPADPSAPPVEHVVVVSPAPAADPPLAAARPPQPATAPSPSPPDPAPHCLPGTAQVISIGVRGKDLRACFDENADDAPEHCVRWRRETGALIAIEPVFTVEATDEAIPSLPDPKTVTFHTLDVNDDDHRLEVIDDTAQICPPDRACMHLKPLIVGTESLERVATDDSYRNGVLAIHDTTGNTWRLEWWDLETGRLRARRALPLPADRAFELTIRVGGSTSVVVLATADGDTRGLIFGVDGSVRGPFAGGAQALGLDGALTTSAAYVLVDHPDDKPFTVHATSLTTGQDLAHFTIPVTGTLSLRGHATLVIAAQDGDPLRLDLLDLRAHTSRTLTIPRC